MMYEYKKLDDETEIVFSHIINECGKEMVLVHFERPTEMGFDSARCEIPGCKWLMKKGFSDMEIRKFEELIEIRWKEILEMAKKYSTWNR